MASESKDSTRPDGNGIWTRRRFLRQSGLVGVSVGMGAAWASSSTATEKPSRILRRVKLGRTGLEVPDIGFGAFSLEHDEDLVRYALDRGITHFDTAESYADGRSEQVLGRALRGRRHQVTLTTKFWASPQHTAAQQMAVLERSLVRLKTDYIDIYLNHAVNDVERLASEEWQAFGERAKAEGKIRHIGMSGHASRLGDCLKYALDHDLVDVVLVAYNFAQQPSFQQGIKRYLHDLAGSLDLVSPQPELPGLLERARAKGVGVMVMKTLKGARRNDMRRFESAGRTFAQAAFRWVLSDPAVDALVVTMSRREMIDEYVAASVSREAIRVSSRSTTTTSDTLDTPDKEDLALLARYEMIQAGTQCVVGCSDCERSCPLGVQIADVMRVRMYALDYGERKVAAREYARLAVGASACLSCDGAPCAGACTSGLTIAGLNRDTHRLLSSG